MKKDTGDYFIIRLLIVQFALYLPNILCFLLIMLPVYQFFLTKYSNASRCYTWKKINSIKKMAKKKFYKENEKKLYIICKKSRQKSFTSINYFE